ncbi:tellurite resistance/C4-dicarboxylate transporter family protein [Gordonia alkaliphila]|uniref:Tellurite resistance/C4-dicarboxylate transporter family protein n=2 Tax=Gordonia alkaliphila TaxID=1053547 RepID=A0ABP8ZDK7_9ACTN
MPSRWQRLRLEHFTFVMATGIVSTALLNTGAVVLSEIVFAIALAGYAVLVAGALAGFLAGLRPVREENASRAARTLAVIAAGGVLAARMVPLHWDTAALVLIVVSAVAWGVLQYGIFAAVVVAASGRGPADSGPGLKQMDGTWFLVVVSTQALAVSLGSWSAAADSDLGATLAALAWGLGVLQLIIVAALVSARLLLVGVAPTDEVSPYWVFLGSGAISILGAAEVLGVRADQPVVPDVLIGGVAMALWAFVTWMLVPTIALTLWQRRRPGAIRGYRAALWSMVFPIGMYGESTRQLGQMRAIDWLVDIGTWEAWVAFAVWLGVVALAAVAVRDSSRSGESDRTQRVGPGEFVR